MDLPSPERPDSSERATGIIRALETVETKKDFKELVKAALVQAHVSEKVADATLGKIDQVFDNPHIIDELFPEESSQSYFRNALKRLSSISLN